MIKRWISNMPVMMVRLGFLEGCDIQNGTKIMSKCVLTTPFIPMTMVDMMVDLMRK